MLNSQFRSFTKFWHYFPGAFIIFCWEKRVTLFLSKLSPPLTETYNFIAHWKLDGTDNDITYDFFVIPCSLYEIQWNMQWHAYAAQYLFDLWVYQSLKNTTLAKTLSSLRKSNDTFKNISSISPLVYVLLLIKSRANKLHKSRSRAGQICFYAHCIIIESKSNLRVSWSL